MPILEVKSTSSDLLQHIADGVGKAKKVVIITGAGISTNSGIPDFRSENGLYSLIQAQFENAEAGEGKDADSQATGFVVSGRPTKRRRISHSIEGPTEQEESEQSNQSLENGKGRDEGNALTKSIGADRESFALRVKNEPAISGTGATALSGGPSKRVTRSQSARRPPLPRHVTQSSTLSSASQTSLSSTQQSTIDSPQTDSSVPSETGDSRDVQTRDATPKILEGETFSSSPLSSPPPILFDPYENANSTENSSQESVGSSDASDTEDTQNSLGLLSSQPSSSSIRNMKGRDLFDCNIWADPLKTSVFYRFATTLRQKIREVEPTATHRFIAQLRDVGKLARVYTQNIDEIEKKIGLSTDLKSGAGNRRRKSAKQQILDVEQDCKENAESTKAEEDPSKVDTAQASQASQVSEVSGRIGTRSVLAPDRGVECVFLHGSLHSLRCFLCGKLCDWDEDGRESCTMSGEQPECPHCAGATAARQEKGKRALGVGKLRPDIVLYGEEHPQSDLISPIVQHDLSASPDLLLILGTSLRVHGLKVMVREFAKAVHNKGGMVVFINLTKPSESAWGDIIDYWIEWDCDAWVDDLKDRKPHLWLSPDEILESEKQKREALAEKKRENMAKKQEGLKDKRRHTIELGKSRPPPKNPSAMRNDYHCGAYVMWEIFQSLAKISNRPFEDFGYVPSSTSRPSAPLPAVDNPIPKAPTATARSRPTVKGKRPRKSAPAALATSTDTSLKPAPTKEKTDKSDSRSQYAKAAQGLARSGTPNPARLAELNGIMTPDARKDTPPPTELSSITAAVKINPRQRKRKMIEGVPVGTTVKQTRKSTTPLPAALGNAEKRLLPGNELTPSSTRSTLPSKGPVLPPFNPGWERSPPARIKPLEPNLNVSPGSPLAEFSPVMRSQVFALRQSTHPMIFSDPLAKLGYGTTNYKKPPQEGDTVFDKTPSPSDQLRWELAQQEALEGAQVLQGLRHAI